MASVVTLAACSWTDTAPLATGIGQPQLTIWSTPGSIDQALARWRRINPNVSVRRQIIAATDLADLLQALPTQSSDIPDIVVADSYTITAQQYSTIWRHIETSTVNAELHPAALGHVYIDDRQIVGLPLTYNPLKLWYQSDILRDTLGLRDTAQVQAAVGNDWNTFVACIEQLHRNNPMLTVLSSCFDDACYPMAVAAMQQQRSITDVLMQSLALAQQRIIGRAVHLSGEWFDLLKRNSVAMMVGGRYLGSAVSRTWNNEIESPWQTISHPFGDLYGPGIVAAIPIQAARYEQATQLMTDFASDVELQILISNESMSMPALRAAYDHSEMQGVDAILPQDTISATWRTQDSVRLPMINARSIMHLQQAKDALYAWQNGMITDAEVTNRLGEIISSSA